MSPIKINLPSVNQTGPNEWSDVESNDQVLKEGVEEAGEQIDAISGITWYKPKVIAPEQTLTSTGFKLMSENGAGGTADEIPGVVLPENGKMLVGYQARAKASAVSGAAALFLGANQVKVPYVGTAGANSATNETQEARILPSKFGQLFSFQGGLVATNGTTNDMPASASTGQILGTVTKEDEWALYQIGANALSLPHGTHGGEVEISADAGTYNVSVKFKALAGSVTAKERKLWVAVLG